MAKAANAGAGSQDEQGTAQGEAGGESAVRQRPNGRTIALFAIVTLACALGCMSQTAVNPMFPALSAEFAVPLGTTQWLVNGYILVIGVAVPLATFLSRRVSVRTHSLIAFVLFIAGSVIDVVAPDFGVMLLGRILQATSTGIMLPLMQVIAIMRFPPGMRATAMGVGGIALGFAPNFGPTAGAALQTALGWRSFFLILLVVNAVLLVATIALVSKEKAVNSATNFEFVSFLFSTAGFGLLLFGVSSASTATNVVAQVVVPVIVGTVFIVLFLRRQKAVDYPLMDLRIFKSAQFDHGLIALVLHFSAFLGVPLLIPLFVQNLCGGTSLDAGMVLLPATFVALAMNPVAGILTDKVGMRPVVLTVCAFLLVGSLLETTVTEDTPFWLLALYQAIRQFGIAGLVGPLQTWTLEGLKGSLVSDGSSTTILLRQVGSSIASAIMVLIVTAGVAAGLASALPYQLAFAFSALLTVAEVAFIVRYVR